MILTANLRGLTPYRSRGIEEDAEDVWRGSAVYEEAEADAYQEDYEAALYQAAAPGLRPRPTWGEYVGRPDPESAEDIERLVAVIRGLL